MLFTDPAFLAKGGKRLAATVASATPTKKGSKKAAALAQREAASSAGVAARQASLPAATSPGKGGEGAGAGVAEEAAAPATSSKVRTADKWRQGSVHVAFNAILKAQIDAPLMQGKRLGGATQHGWAIVAEKLSAATGYDFTADDVYTKVRMRHGCGCSVVLTCCSSCSST